MRIISLNVNGVKAAAERGLFDWLRTQDADVICLQDIRVTAPELEQDPYWLDGYWQYCFEAETPSQGGVAIYTRTAPKAIIMGLGFETADRYGRFMQADFDKVSIGSLLLPSGRTNRGLPQHPPLLRSFRISSSSVSSDSMRFLRRNCELRNKQIVWRYSRSDSSSSTIDDMLWA